ncbi:MAG: hypothetical protein VYE67_05685, partial [Planctomycetota bacterium]|nr:hypothetical protein [Planctomycetota bacterium]
MKLNLKLADNKTKYAGVFQLRKGGLPMDDSQFEAVAQLVFMWIGFGTVVGLAAKAIMPGRDP